MVDGIKVKVWMKIEGVNRLCEVVASSLPECIMGMDIVSDWGKLLLPAL